MMMEMVLVMVMVLMVLMMVTRRVTRTSTGELRRGGSVTRDKQTIRSGDSSAR